MALSNQHICTCLTEPFLCHTAISTKTKCAGSIDLFFALNQAMLNILCIQRDDNHRSKHEVYHMWTEILQFKMTCNFKYCELAFILDCNQFSCNQELRAIHVYVLWLMQGITYHN